MVWPAAISAGLGVATAGIRSTVARMAVSKTLGRIPSAMKYSQRLAKYAAPVGAGIMFGDKAAKVTKWGGAAAEYVRKTTGYGQGGSTGAAQRRRGASFEYIYKY